MFRIKICGVTEPGDAEMAVSFGADAVGVNFFRGSPRCVSVAKAREIVSVLRGRALPVAVFVNEEPGVICSTCRNTGIEAVQLSGNEDAEDVSRIPYWRIKAIHAHGTEDFSPYIGYPCDAFLMDAGGSDAYGGTGRCLDWRALAGPAARPILGRRNGPGGGPGKPWALAGGLTPENVGEAIRTARPFGVDVASGVESSVGKKDPEKVGLFVREAKEAFGLEGT